MDNSTYFQQYLFRNALKREKPKNRNELDYLLTDEGKLLLKYQTCSKLDPITIKTIFKHPEFSPLTALELMKIIIKPARILLGQV